MLPVYQRQRQGEQAVRSALAQDVDGLEVVVVDDGSEPAFVLPAGLAADPRVRLLRQSTNRGAAAARNRAIAVARGAWIAFLDSDDAWEPGKLRAQLALAARVPPLSAIVTGYRRIEVATGRVRELVPMASRDPADFACGCWFSPGATALVPRAAFELVGPFDETLERLEDFDWYLRFVLAGGGIAVVPAIAASVHVGARAPNARVARAVSQLRAKWLGPGHTLAPRYARNLRAALALELAASSWFAGRYPVFAWHLLRSQLACPRPRLHLRRWWLPPSIPGHPAPPAA